MQQNIGLGSNNTRLCVRAYKITAMEPTWMVEDCAHHKSSLQKHIHQCMSTTPAHMYMGREGKVQHPVTLQYILYLSKCYEEELIISEVSETR